MTENTLEGIYKEKGEYHRYLDPNWNYYPTYLEKQRYLKKLIKELPEGIKMLDAGCGEGLLVEYLVSHGFDAIGLDLNYSSNLVVKGDIRDRVFDDESFDVIFCLDAIEHLNYNNQVPALKNLIRMLKRGGTLILGLPNLAHLSSRFRFFFRGRLWRTASIEWHPGDRPIKEYLGLLEEEMGIKIMKRKGITPTIPILYHIICNFTKRTLWLHRFMGLFAIPGWCLLNIIVCQKENV